MLSSRPLRWSRRLIFSLSPVFRCRARSITSWLVVSTTAVNRATRKGAPGQRTTSHPNRVATATPSRTRPRWTSVRCSISSRRRVGSRTGPSIRCTYFRRNTGKPETRTHVFVQLGSHTYRPAVYTYLYNARNMYNIKTRMIHCTRYTVTSAWIRDDCREGRILPLIFEK